MTLASLDDVHVTAARILEPSRSHQRPAPQPRDRLSMFIRAIESLRQRLHRSPPHLDYSAFILHPGQIEQQAFARFHDAMSSMRTEFGDVSQLIEERFDEFKRLEIGVQDARGRLAAIEMLMSTIRRALPSEPSVMPAGSTV